MSIHYLHRHVLEDLVTGFSAERGANHIAVVRRPTVVSVLAHAGREVSVGEALRGIAGVKPRYCSPSEWLLVSRVLGAEHVADALAEIAGASFVDQSDAKVLLSISGPAVRMILAKCTAVDLHPEVFTIGRSANALICHVPGNLARTGGDEFDLIVPRSFAVSVFEELLEMGREHVLTRGFTD
jgi:heterotetrameric sarcosine oxidase gamma subunit